MLAVHTSIPEDGRLKNDLKVQGQIGLEVCGQTPSVQETNQLATQTRRFYSSEYLHQ